LFHNQTHANEWQLLQLNDRQGTEGSFKNGTMAEAQNKQKSGSTLGKR